MTFVVAVKLGLKAEAAIGGDNETINSIINHSLLLILE
jgi:hypothetical protein